jgi:hypothetical protein
VTLRVRWIDDEQEIAIRRDFVRFDSITDPRNRAEWEPKWLDAQDPRIAHLKFTRFSSSTVHELLQNEAQLRSTKCRLVMLDLRDLQVQGDWQHAQLIADALIAGGTMWEEQNRSGNVMQIVADDDCLFRGHSLIVLTSGRSPTPASAVAHALQTLRQATVIEDFAFAEFTKTDDVGPIGYPTEAFPLAGGRWMLNVPTRRCHAVSAESGRVGSRYTLKHEFVPLPEQAVIVNGKKRLVRLPPGVRQPVITIEPPIAGFVADQQFDADTLAMKLAKMALDETEKDAP